MATVSIVECQKRTLKMQLTLPSGRNSCWMRSASTHMTIALIHRSRWRARYPPLENEHINELALIAFLPPHHGQITHADSFQHQEIILSRGLPAGFSTPSAASGRRASTFEILAFDNQELEHQHD